MGKKCTKTTNQKKHIIPKPLLPNEYLITSLLKVPNIKDPSEGSEKKLVPESS